jgi:hypothetical protein
VYGSKGRLRKKFVLSIKAVLDDLGSLAEELRQSFPLHADERFGGISRMPAHLHLSYYQARPKPCRTQNQSDKYLDHCCCDEAIAFLLLEESLRVTKRSATVGLITQNTASTAHIT